MLAYGSFFVFLCSKFVLYGKRLHQDAEEGCD